MKNIGISEDKLHHILGVARKCYKLAKEAGYNEQFCRKMFMIGWLHDVGYEFTDIASEHNETGVKMISTLSNDLTDDSFHSVLSAVESHGRYQEEKSNEWRILNMADLTVDRKGRDINVHARLSDIEQRYGSESKQYIRACAIARTVGLCK